MIILGCCKAINVSFKKGDRIINNCTSCAIICEENYPEIRCISIYEYLLEDLNFKWPNYNKSNFLIQDCYRSNHKKNTQEAIRTVLNRMNINIIEIEENFESCNFDGLLKYKKLPDILFKAAPKYYDNYAGRFQELIPESDAIKELNKHKYLYTCDDVVVYCNSCYQGLKTIDVKVKHILELIFK